MCHTLWHIGVLASILQARHNVRGRSELIGNPVQSGGLNRERLYRAGFNPPQAELNGRERDRDDSLNSNDQNRRLPNVHLIF